jgi:guanylate cyclase
MTNSAILKCVLFLMPICGFFLQILNRTNNIFELVTVEPVLTERPSDRKRDIVLLSDESDGLPDDKKLRLKGVKHKYE